MSITMSELSVREESEVREDLHQNCELRRELMSKRYQVLQKWSQKLDDNGKLLLCLLLEMHKANATPHSSHYSVGLDCHPLQILIDLILSDSIDLCFGEFDICKLGFGDSTTDPRRYIDDTTIHEYLDRISEYMEDH
jgi:hypothetical protein